MGLIDDAALLTPPSGHDLVLTTDTLVEGVHFPLGSYGADVAQRLLRTNLSDLAAKGASPLGYMLLLAIPPVMDEALLVDFTKGLKSVQESFPPLTLYGGDTVKIAGPMVVSATLIGTVPNAKMVKRSGAGTDQDVWVSGSIGEGYMGLKCALGQAVVPPPTDHARSLWQAAYMRPEPRLSLAGVLRKVATAAADVSDGLVADAGHIARASGLRITLKLPDIPFSTATFIWANGQGANQADRIKAKVTLITAGDDYEIVFTALREHRALIEHTAQEVGVPLSRIGYTTAGKGIAVLDYADEVIEISSTGYQHF